MTYISLYFNEILYLLYKKGVPVKEHLFEWFV
jgi:hypothetical protein